jgi:hypothetical protein
MLETQAPFYSGIVRPVCLTATPLLKCLFNSKNKY